MRKVIDVAVTATFLAIWMSAVYVLLLLIIGG